jgi:hypothetical protein
MHGNTIATSTSFVNVPVSTATLATLSISGTLASASNFSIDEDGNGSTDITLKSGGVVLGDVIPPVTTATTTGILGMNGWYTSNALVTLNATDTESGVASTTYSIDGLATSTGTTTKIVTEGIHTITYYSIDKAGNLERATSTIIKIDKTAPEATIGFSTTTKKVLAMGSDNLSATTLSTTTASIVVADKSGHALMFKVSQNTSQPSITCDPLILL